MEMKQVRPTDRPTERPRHTHIPRSYSLLHNNSTAKIALLHQNMFWAIFLFCAAIRFDIYTVHRIAFISFGSAPLGAAHSAVSVCTCEWVRVHEPRSILLLSLMACFWYCSLPCIHCCFANSLHSHIHSRTRLWNRNRVLFYESNANE